ncbi:MAG TPA: hypothetical protein VM582_09045, partial [Candidatus Thermoplasmatota archaeon]|nr:hypothetical protein [Candidatus Thermoplasmatota archaeon]
DMLPPAPAPGVRALLLALVLLAAPLPAAEAGHCSWTSRPAVDARAAYLDLRSDFYYTLLVDLWLESNGVDGLQDDYAAHCQHVAPDTLLMRIAL